jgi:hypothetical protein
VEASGVAQFAGGPEDRRLRLVLLGPLSDQRLFCGWELASRATAAFSLRSTRQHYSENFRNELRSSRGNASQRDSRNSEPGFN